MKHESRIETQAQLAISTEFNNELIVERHYGGIETEALMRSLQTRINRGDRCILLRLVNEDPESATTLDEIVNSSFSLQVVLGFPLSEKGLQHKEAERAAYQVMDRVDIALSERFTLDNGQSFRFQYAGWQEIQDNQGIVDSVLLSYKVHLSYERG